ncbi:MAG TPA: TraB/GumN family protein [Chitinophagaceae bacterium]|nr:TraB/GumN family protein [Chitinophagaceae bacterium]
MKSVIIMFGCCIFFFGCRSQSTKYLPNKNADNNTLLWQVSGKELKKPSYLFGTFHLLCKDDIKFSEQLKKSLISADEVYMEMDLDDPSTMLSGLLYMNMKDGKKLKNLYTTEEYTKVENYFKDSLGMPMMLFQSMKPYFLVAMLYPKMMNCKTASGVEEELIKIAKDNKKEIKGLETMQLQASVFDSIPYEWQAKELLKNIDSFSTYKKEFDTMISEYKNQQLSAMEKLLAKSEFGSDKKYKEILLTKRNINWVGQLKSIMKKESVFVAVGAGHLVGEKGLINLLRKEGYTVEALENK